MSQRYKGAILSATPPTTTGGNSGTAPGEWTLQQQLQDQGAGNWTNQPIWYVEDVFRTYLYTGNGSTQTITNGIDLAGKGGLVWTKSRSNAQGHRLSDTARGIYNTIFTNTTDAQVYDTTYLTNFGATGFTLGTTNNSSGQNYASWTFRKQPKFFDVVTYTGSTSGVTINHSLGSVPGCIIIKKTSSASANGWYVWHRDLASAGGNPSGAGLCLNSTAAAGGVFGLNGQVS